MPLNKSTLIKTIYFYLVSLIALMMVVFSIADLFNIALKTWVFTKADRNPYSQPKCATMVFKDPSLKETDDQYSQRLQQCEQGRVDEQEAFIVQKQQSAVRDISFIVVGLPLFLYHWITIRKDKESNKA
ncbi:MAG: hypothetical protein WC766_02730 [Patescibacteria group bacterium]|jgi:hypothetical protein